MVAEKTIIILGMAPSRNQCPFDAEVWSVNTGYRQIAEMNRELNEMKGHVEKIFLAHLQVPDPEDGIHIFDWNELNRLREAGVDVINIHRVKGLNSRLYPLKRIAEKFECDYFSNTICYMLAYAIDKATSKKNGRVKLKYPLTIRMYGIDMKEKIVEGQGEYTIEKGGVEYWVGYARGLGIKVTMSVGGEVCKTYTRKPYGVKYFNKRLADPFNLIGRKRRLTKKRHAEILARING